MSDCLQDEPRLPVPETKGIAIAVIGIIFLIAVFIKAGMSTKDPQKDINEVAEDYRTTTGEKTSESTQGTVDNMADSFGATHEQGAEDDSLFIKESITKNTELANESSRSSGTGSKLTDSRLPSPSIDTHGHPVTVNRDHYTSDATTNTAEKNFVIPKLAEGWDPEREILVPATNQTPAYRYQPAYLTGSNNPHRLGDLEQLDNVWLNSISMPSYGHSLQVNAAFNEGLPPVAMKQSVHNNELIRLNNYKGTRQPVRQT